MLVLWPDPEMDCIEARQHNLLWWWAMMNDPEQWDGPRRDAMREIIRNRARFF